MHNSKTIALLKSLDSSEMRQFTHFIKSPYFLKSEDAIALYTYLIRYAPEFTSPRICKETVFKKLFPKEKYSDIKLRNLMRKITKVLEEFLLLQDLHQDEYRRKKQLKNIYGKRNLYSYFERETFQLIDTQKALPYRDSEYFFEEYELLRDWYFHPSTLKNSENVKQFETAVKAFFQYVQIEQLQFECEFKNRERIFNESYCLKELGKKPIGNITVELYEMILQLIESQKEEDYFNTKEFFLSNLLKLRKREVGLAYTTLLNFAIQQSSKQELKYFNEAFFLYKIGLENDFLINDNQIEGVIFINIVIIASKLEEFNWAKTFISEYQPFLKNEFKESYFNLAIAFWNFHQKQFSKTIDYLLKIDFKDNLFSINERTLLNRAYFELFLKDENYFPLLISNLNSFDKHIRRQSQINALKKEAYLNFVGYLRKLTKFTQRKDIKSIQKLEKQIIEETLVISKSWIIEKTKENFVG